MQTDVWFKYSARISFRNCFRYAMLYLCFVRFSEPLQTSKMGKNSSIGCGGGGITVVGNGGVHIAYFRKKNKKNRKLLIFTVRCETQCVVGSWLNN